MPNIRDEINYDAMSPRELQEKRRAFLDQAEKMGGAHHLSALELHGWLEVTRQLRKKNSGPAKKPKKPKGEPVTSADLVF